MTADVYQCYSCCEWLPHMVFLCRQMFRFFHLLITSHWGHPWPGELNGVPTSLHGQMTQRGSACTMFNDQPIPLLQFHILYVYHNHSAMKGYIYLIIVMETSCLLALLEYRYCEIHTEIQQLPPLFTIFEVNSWYLIAFALQLWFPGRLHPPRLNMWLSVIVCVWVWVCEIEWVCVCVCVRKCVCMCAGSKD